MTLTVKARKVVVKGKRGTLEKEFKHIKVEMIVKQEKDKKFLEINSYLTSYKHSAILYTIQSHIDSMIKGVSVGFRYKMLCVKKHFPITVNVLTEQNKVEIKNFIGCKENILVDILPGVTAIRNDKNPEGEVWFEGNDKQLVSQNCSLVNQACNVGDKDKRKFLDGIYVSERGLIQQ